MLFVTLSHQFFFVYIEKAKEIRQIHNVDVWSITPCVTNTLGYGTAMITLYPTYNSLK